MSKQLEKTLKDAKKDKKYDLGTKQVLGAIKNSKLIVMSQSLDSDVEKQIEESAATNKVPTVKFNGSSVALGKLCGLQFRVSTISLTSVTDGNIKSILKENETE